MFACAYDPVHGLHWTSCLSVHKRFLRQSVNSSSTNWESELNRLRLLQRATAPPGNSRPEFRAPRHSRSTTRRMWINARS